MNESHDLPGCAHACCGTELCMRMQLHSKVRQYYTRWIPTHGAACQIAVLMLQFIQQSFLWYIGYKHIQGVSKQSELTPCIAIILLCAISHVL